MFEDKTFLITGGTGSFGNAVLRRLLKTDAKEIRIFSRDEKKQEDMRIELSNPRVNFYIGDVRSFDSINYAMNGVDYVFNAAALKQVPSCEFYPIEAIKTNILGAENVLNSALANNVEKVIFLSTDKAVYPINAMGISKAMMEKLMIAKSRMVRADQTMFAGTRYGNVMASRGSVIPLFIGQIKSGKPITITDPDMTRFMMSLEDAVDLVLFAFENGSQGDVFVQKSPATSIGVLAEAIQKLFNSSMDIQIIGTRHGEKKNETLLTREEKAVAIDRGDYYQVPSDNRDLNYNKYFVEGEGEITFAEDYSSDNTHQLSVAETVDLLLTLDYVKQELEA